MQRECLRGIQLFVKEGFGSKSGRLFEVTPEGEIVWESFKSL
jgi:hypothetical protein